MQWEINEITTMSCRVGVLLTALRDGNKCEANPGWRSSHPVNSSLGRLDFKKNWFTDETAQSMPLGQVIDLTRFQSVCL